MAATVLHFGMDVCNRIPVLREIGYSVDVCSTLTEFRATIREETDAEAVLIPASRTGEHLLVAKIAREYSLSPLVLFESSYTAVDVGAFDLVIPPLVPPEDWLRSLADLIERSRALHADSKAIREQAALLRREHGTSQSPIDVSM